MRSMFSGTLIFLAIVLVPFARLSAADRTALPADAVLVIGALHDLHSREPGFGYEHLKAIVLAFEPDVLVLEVRPEELLARGETPGRPEYPRVVWPLLRQLSAISIAMEPGGAIFHELAGGAGAAFEIFQRRNPQAALTLRQLEATAKDSLLEYWTSPGRAQDETTAAVVRGTQAMQFALVGPKFESVQRRWDGYMATRALETVAANPGKRVLVLGSYRNRPMLETEIRKAAPGRLVEADKWVARLP